MYHVSSEMEGDNVVEGQYCSHSHDSVLRSKIKIQLKMHEFCRLKFYTLLYVLDVNISATRSKQHLSLSSRRSRQYATAKLSLSTGKGDNSSTNGNSFMSAKSSTSTTETCSNLTWKGWYAHVYFCHFDVFAFSIYLKQGHTLFYINFIEKIVYFQNWPLKRCVFFFMTLPARLSYFLATHPRIPEYYS